MCFQHLFRNVSPLTASNFYDRLTTISTIGKVVRRIKVDIKDLDSSVDGPLSTVVKSLKNLEELTLIYDKDEAQGRPELVEAICGLRFMTTLRVEEAGLDVNNVPADDGKAAHDWHFIDYMLNNLLSSVNMDLRSLTHLGSTSLHSTVLHTLRTQPTRLRTLALRGSIQYGLRGRFNEQTRWSSAATLKELTIDTCSGTNYATIARHVVSGVFGYLKHLVVIGSGYINDDLFGLPWLGPSILELDLLEIDHAIHWEVLALAIIPVKVVYVTRVPHRAIVEVLAQGGWLGIKSIKVQNLSDRTPALSTKLKQVCADQHVELQVGAIPYGRCDCHDVLGSFKFEADICGDPRIVHWCHQFSCTYPSF